jgi:hypothetical protein
MRARYEAHEKAENPFSGKILRSARAMSLPAALFPRDFSVSPPARAGSEPSLPQNHREDTWDTATTRVLVAGWRRGRVDQETILAGERTMISESATVQEVDFDLKEVKDVNAGAPEYSEPLTHDISLRLATGDAQDCAPDAQAVVLPGMRTR